MNVLISQLDKGIPLPAYGRIGDAGLDLRSTESFRLLPESQYTVGCGFAIAIPEGYAGLVLPRSGLAAKYGIGIVNAPGLVDSNYRGEVKVILINHSASDSFDVKRGDRIAQMIITPIPVIELQCVESLGDSIRGDAGFGSSGVE